MKYIINIIIIILISCNVYAQTGSLHGTINDSSNKAPITDATIQLADKYITTSNTLGYFSFGNIPSGSYILKVSRIGYNSESLNVTVTNDNKHIEIILKPDNVKLDEVIITSSKYEKNINELPYSASLVTKEEIGNNPAMTISDILKNEPGISILSDGVWGTDVSIRGMNRSNIVTLVDGNRIETATDISARLSMIDLNDIERIEVIKGSASALYGSGASGGVVNLITKTGGYRNDFSIQGTVLSAFNSVNNYFSNGINLLAGSTNWFGKVSGTFRKAQNVKTPQGELQNSQFEDNSLSAFLQYRPFEHNEIKLNYQQFKATNVGIPGAYPLFPSTATIRYPEEKRQLFSAEYIMTFENTILSKLSAKYFHQYIFRDVENIPHTVQNVAAANGQPPKRVSVLQINPSAKHNIDGVQSQADFIIDNHYLIAGVDIWRRKYSGERFKQQKIEVLNAAKDTVKSTSYKTIYEKPLPDATFNSTGVFAQDEIKLFNNKLSVTIGGRFDYIFIRNNDIINPIYEITNGKINYAPAGQILYWKASTAKNNSYVYNLGLVYSLLEDLNISFNASRSFRSPSLEERFQYIDQGSIVQLGNPQLSPEKGYFFDAGFHYTKSDLYITGNVFYNKLTDLVSDSATTYEGRKATVKMNVGKAVLYGFEFSSGYTFIPNFKLYDNVSYVRGKNEKDHTDLALIPALNGTIGLKANIYKTLILDISAVIYDKQDKIAQGELATPGYAIYNFSCNAEILKFDLLSLNLTAGIE
ncbi:MAG: TonB-dependent receptor, partial [Bacteroidota bacterium]|nr:TonB-dependent receptor [Bacteroidota bacterium]